MTVYFIGAGPGAPDLITVRGLKLIERCLVCLYAGSLVPEAVVKAAPDDALVKDTAPMHLDEIIAEIETANAAGKDVARVHSGDPSIYGATAEQIRRLEALDIPFEIVPGVSAYAAAAAELKTELTLPEITQSIVITRVGGKASAMPEGEELETFAKSRATLAIHLSIRQLAQIEETLTPYYGADCPVIVVYRASWPDQMIVRGTLSTIRDKVRVAKITRTALIFVGRVFEAQSFRDSALYDAAFQHVLRNRGKRKRAV